MAAYTTTTLRTHYHDALVDWQQRNFPEMDILLKYWDKYFPGQTPFQLVAKIGDTKSETIEYGKFAGQKRFEKAGSMVGNMFYSARDIIKAQCSTELGSIQQHRMTIDQAISDEAKFAMLRVQAEELRHAYQMFWVLEHDLSWKKPGHGDVAEETIELLLGMELGSHVLDAFNIHFDRFLDNVMFTAVIDLVGKYQLDMQRVFSYGPMARSMGPMFSEEGFHLGTGRKFLKEIAVNATKGQGEYSISDVQQAFNQWFPRGLEMFGNEQGGVTSVTFGFKDRTNGEAQDQYAQECQGIVDNTNLAILQVLVPGIAAEEGKKLSQEILQTGNVVQGVSPEQLVFLPARNFLRKRGPEDVVFKPVNPRGETLTKDNKPLAADEYVEYLKGVLPAGFIKDNEFAKYAELLQAAHRPEAPMGYGLN
ncbi:MAG: hypothetical protein K1Y36_07180 [Blastocatellia bacterium]|nr:hypothetical protein [Blastocatellia bacterium]